MTRAILDSDDEGDEILVAPAESDSRSQKAEEDGAVGDNGAELIEDSTGSTG